MNLLHNYTKPLLIDSSYGGHTEVKSGPSDHWLLVIVIMLMVGGLLAVYSSIAFFAETRGTTAGDLYLQHAAKLLISLLVMVIISKVDYRIVARMSRYTLLLSWIFLVVVTLYGNELFGARRALYFGSFSFQPSSLAVVSLLIYVGSLIHEKQEYIHSFTRTFLPLMVWVLITCALIGIEDFSSAALLLMMCLIVMFIGRVRLLHISGFLLIGLTIATLFLATSPERKSRVVQYSQQMFHVETTDFQLTSGYQTQQAQIAIARGGLMGVGMGKSTQRDFLPAPYNDFIFAIITEEYGLLGAGAVLILYLILLYRGLMVIARRAKDRLAMLLAAASTLGVTMYAFVNAAVTAGLLPVTGLPMPFISYGGTSMLFSGLLIGILLNISKHREEGYAG